jgi:hypothetical protein
MLYDIYDMMYLLTAIGLKTVNSSTVHIYTQTTHTTTQWKQNIQNRIYITVGIRKMKPVAQYCSNSNRPMCKVITNLKNATDNTNLYITTIRGKE